MSDIALPALRGHNPLGLFAALGALDVVTRRLPERRATLRWTTELQPHAVLAGPDDPEHLIDLCDADRARWAESPVLAWAPPRDRLPDDLKVTRGHVRRWFEHVLACWRASGDRADLDLLGALLAEGATAGRGTSDESKPTHFHFTAGRQKFLAMVRDLRVGLDRERFTEALLGPWRYDSPLPVLGWDARGERIYALRGFNPADEKRLGVPGADWLAFLGLRYFPVAARRGELVTTGCVGSWKEGSFRWPLWCVPLGSDAVASLVADRAIDALDVPSRRALGVHHLLNAPIRRAAQGGYGSFGAPGIVVPDRSAGGRAGRRSSAGWQGNGRRTR